MGLIDKFKEIGKFNKLSKAVAGVIELIDEYEKTGDIDYLFTSAWLARVGIFDIMDQYNFAPSSKIFITTNNKIERMTLNEALHRSVWRLSIKAASLVYDDDKDIVSDILERGKFFYQMDINIPANIKEKIL